MDVSRLKATLALALSERPTRAATREMIALCHRIAKAYVERKRRRGRLAAAVLGLGADDLAMDCVAGLFERNEQGRFVRLIQYFERVRWEGMDGDDLLEATRRLVFSQVNDHLFALYGEVDPGLALLLRRLKRVIKEEASVRLARRAGRRWVVFGEETAAALPLMPPEYLEAHLAAGMRAGMVTQQELQVAAHLFRLQGSYRKRYPLIALAQAMRAAAVRAGGAPGDGATTKAEAPLVLQQRDVTRLIEQSVATTQAALWATYVGKEKVDEATYGVYFDAIRDRLSSQYVQERGTAQTNYEVLRAYLPALTREAYGQAHRTIFEYLSRLTRTALVETLRREL